MSIAHLYVLFREASILVLHPFFPWIVCLPGVELCRFFIILDFNSLADISLANMFSQAVRSLTILLTVSRAVLCREAL